MRRLGYDRFGAHGGDFGSLVSPELGRLFKDNVIGVHVNGLFCPTPTEPGQLATLTDDDKARLDRVNRFMRRDRGYAVLQAATPQTLAYGLTDSPVGQLAWIVEKFKLWTDSAERPEDAIDRDQLLTNVMLYWLTGTAGSSARLYKETAGDLRVMSVPRSAPTGVAVFPREPLLPVRSVAELAHNIVQWSEFDRGGHFAAMEVPDLLIGDIRTFFRRFR